MTNVPPDDLLQDESDDEPDPAPGGELALALAQRLEQLHDPAWMNAVLEPALLQMTGTGAAVAGHDIEYCKIKPNRDINLALRVRTAGADAPPRRLSCTIYASPDASRLKYAEEQQAAPPESTRRRLLADGFTRPLALLDEQAMIVRAFPLDPALPGLAWALDADAMLPLFADCLEACRHGALPRGFRHEVLHYKPRRSCAIHYQVALGDGDDALTARVYGKLARDDRGEKNHALLTAAHAAARASGGRWQAARPLDYVRRWRLQLQEAVPGRDFRLVFADLTPDAASADELAAVGALLDAIAAAIRSLQRAPIPPGPSLTFGALLAAQARNLQYMQGLQPALAAELAAIRREAARLERETRANAPVFAHGDFAHGNVLIDGDRVGIIDFDKAGAAEPAHDVGYFLTHLWSFGIRHEKRMPHVVRLGERFRAAFLALAPEVTAERLALYEALDFAAYVLRNFRKQSHQAKWLAWANAQVAAAWDRLGVAAGRKGA
jgi:aminoglycoside phosphotransferase (APT) family kinase protein